MTYTANQIKKYLNDTKDNAYWHIENVKNLDLLTDQGKRQSVRIAMQKTITAMHAVVNVSYLYVGAITQEEYDNLNAVVDKIAEDINLKIDVDF